MRGILGAPKIIHVLNVSFLFSSSRCNTNHLIPSCNHNDDKDSGGGAGGGDSNCDL